ncbi:MAG TPA: DNA replication and repair protein RecF [Ignavibacteria bacterium]|nr:DNA replication and repair protein RecF [Ignavibacteria bacterium]HRA99729.1 DNA replication and repair protein RecF [Ignavibacteria bacterium]
MILKRIVLKNFRNYSGQEINFNNKFNFIYGNNGQGKTNILEAVSYSTYGKSFLGSSEADCVKFGDTEFFVESDFINDLGNKDFIVINYDSHKKSKTIHRNKQKVNSFSAEVFGRFPLVFLSPKSLNITYGNPSDRRKFFDILISQTSNLYLDHLKELAKTLKQKSALLREYSLHRKLTFSELKDLLNSYNEKLSDVSSRVLFKRINFLREFESYFDRNFQFLLKQDHKGSITYSSDITGEIIPKNSETGLDELRSLTDKILLQKFNEEIKRAVTLVGPQRDEYVFKLSKLENEEPVSFDLKNFASQGEHKTFLLALKLSEYDFLKNSKSTSPVLLLDDILSELDEERVSMIISHLKDYGQIFLTTTDKDYLERLKTFYTDDEISEFYIEDGNVK